MIATKHMLEAIAFKQYISHSETHNLYNVFDNRQYLTRLNWTVTATLMALLKVGVNPASLKFKPTASYLTSEPVDKSTSTQKFRDSRARGMA